MKKKPLPTPFAVKPTPEAPVRELATQAHEGTPHYGDYGHAAPGPAPILPPDHRAEGGDVFDLRTEQTAL